MRPDKLPRKPVRPGGRHHPLVEGEAKEDLSLEPDVFIITATPSQAEIVMRAMSYRW